MNTQVLIFVTTVAIVLSIFAIIYIFYSDANIFRKHKKRYSNFINRIDTINKWNLQSNEYVLYERFKEIIKFAFSLTKGEEQFIEPDDDILETYKLLENNDELFDCFELMDLDTMLQKEFKVSIQGKEKLSFGQVFEKIKENSKRVMC